MSTSEEWPERETATFDEFLRAVRPYSSQGFGQFRTFAFRGQAKDEWALRPTLARELKAYEKRTGKMLPSAPSVFEGWLLLQFQQRAHLYAPVESLARGGSDLEWMVMGRHYGLPSRLLDWTYSPFAAAWMACADQPASNGFVWCVSVDHVNAKTSSGLDALMFGTGEHLNKLVMGMEVDPGLIFFTPRTHSRRSASQQGTFSISSKGDEDHDIVIPSILSSYPLPKEKTRLRIVIPAGRKREFIRELRAMNVTAETLSPDLDGCCRELLELLRDYPEELAATHAAAIRSIEEQRAEQAEKK